MLHCNRHAAIVRNRKLVHILSMLSQKKNYIEFLKGTSDATCTFTRSLNGNMCWQENHSHEHSFFYAVPIPICPSTLGTTFPLALTDDRCATLTEFPPTIIAIINTEFLLRFSSQRRERKWFLHESMHF